MAVQEITFAPGVMDQLAQAIGQELRDLYNPTTRGGGGIDPPRDRDFDTSDPTPGRTRATAFSREAEAQRTLLTKLQNLSFDTVESAINSYDALVKYSTLRNANALENILDRYGGNFTKAYITRNKELDSLGEGLTRSQVELFNASTRMFRDTDLGNYYERIETMQRDMYFMQDQLSSRTYNAAVDMTEGVTQQALMFKQTMGFTGTEVATLLRRGYVESGETSEEILNNIAFHAAEMSEATGIPLKHLAHGIKEVMSDMQTFTTMTEAQAARLTASLMEMGVSMSGFEGMLTPFRDFSTAATKMGEISSIFGVQLDAMEMMYLANEDEEKFLHRMREDLIAQGVDMENMSGARQRVLSRTLGMSMEETRTFLSTGERLTSMSELQSASAKANARDQAEAFQLLKDQKMPQVFNASTQELRLMEVEIAKNARSVLRMKENVAGVNEQLSKLANTKIAKQFQDANAEIQKIGSDLPGKVISAFEVNMSSIKPGLEAMVNDMGDAGKAAGEALGKGVEEAVTKDGSPLDHLSPSVFYMRSVRPGLISAAEDMGNIGALGGAYYASGFEAAVKAGSTDIELPKIEVPDIELNPFASMSSLATDAGNQSANNFISALSMLSADQLGEVLGTNLVEQLKADFEASASISVDEIALSPSSTFVVDGGVVEMPDMQVLVDDLKTNIVKKLVPAISDEDVKAINKNLSKSVLEYEKKKHTQLRNDMKEAIAKGFKSLGSVSYNGDISLKIDGKEMLKGLSDAAKVELTSIAIGTTANDRRIMTTNSKS